MLYRGHIRHNVHEFLLKHSTIRELYMSGDVLEMF
jgi:hypothetical protein